MSGFDQNRVYSIAVHDNASKSAPDSASEIKRRLLDFLLQYRVGGEFIYWYVMVTYVAF
jgi:DNA replication licensing factor MCM5